MLLDFIVNFCILFTFAILTYIPFQNKLNLFIPSVRYHPFLLGILGGFTGCLLMLKSVNVSPEVIVDGRLAVISLTGLLGGPFATLISATIIGIFRMFINGYTLTSLIAGSNTIFIGFIIGLCIWKKPMTFHNVHYYFAFSIIQSSLLICYLHNWSLSSFFSALAFIVYSIISFSIIFLIVKQLNILFNKINQIEEMSLTDYLTGLNNNRKFQEYAQNLLEKKEEFSLILLDIDHFKKVNDTYGHPIGDEVLKEVGHRLKDSTYSFGGIVSRNGGEEFSVLLPKTAQEKSVLVAEIVRKCIQVKPFQISTGEQLTISVSGGISTYPINGVSVHHLYKLADEALYKAKLAGRNNMIHITET